MRKDGRVIIGIIDKESFLGKLYESKREESMFYKYANFYSVGEILGWLQELGFKNFKSVQTIFTIPEKMREREPVKEGYGEGGFVVISAERG